MLNKKGVTDYILLLIIIIVISVVLVIFYLVVYGSAPGIFPKIPNPFG